MLKTSHSTGLSENSPTAVVVEDDEVESGGGGGGADESIENLSKSRKSKNPTKLENINILSKVKNLKKPDIRNNLPS